MIYCAGNSAVLQTQHESFLCTWNSIIDSNDKIIYVDPICLEFTEQTYSFLSQLKGTIFYICYDFKNPFYCVLNFIPISREILEIQFSNSIKSIEKKEFLQLLQDCILEDEFEKFIDKIQYLAITHFLEKSKNF